VATRGDSLAEVIERRGLGITVPPGDVDALASALGTMLDDDGRRAECAANAVALAPELVWSKALAPLVEFCRAPRRAPDLDDGDLVAGMRHDLVAVEKRWRGLAYDARAGLEYLRSGGPRLVAAKATGRIRRLVTGGGD
jgi:hypothetical protein